MFSLLFKAKIDSSFPTWSGLLLALVLFSLGISTACGTGSATPSNGPAVQVTMPLRISTQTLPPATAGSPYTSSLAVSGGIPPYVWSISSGALPTGLNLGQNNGLISGMTNDAGSFVFQATVRDSGSATFGKNGRLNSFSSSPEGRSSASLSLNVLEETSFSLPITITSLSLQSATVGVPYWAALAATGGVSPYSWDIPSGSLPPGFALTSNSGVISGLASQTGDFSFQATVIDSKGMTTSVPLSIVTVAKTLPLNITTSALPPATVEAPYTASLVATGGVPLYSWEISSGSLPPGFSLTPYNGVIGGTTDQAGDFSFQATVTDSAGATASVALSIATVLNTTPCGTPLYACNYSGSATVQTPSAPFSSVTLTNSTSRETILSGALISRVTDPDTGDTPCTDNNWNATPSGGDNDVVVNTNTTLYIPSCSGGEHFVIGFNPVTLEVFPMPPTPFANDCGIGATAFSRSSPVILYCMPQDGYNVPGGGTANGTTIYTVTFAYASGTNLCGKGIGNCPDPTTTAMWTPLYDLRNCPQATNATPTWTSTMGVAAGDAAIGESISWTGDQGTAHLFFEYIPGIGCQTFDTQGNHTNPVWYSTSGTPTTITAITATWFIHDSFITSSWASIQKTDCSGISCGTGDGSPMWLMGTSNVVMTGLLSVGTGHFTLSPSFYYGNPNPQVYTILLSNTAIQTEIAATNCTPCQDSHYSGDIQADANPLIGSTAGTTNEIWTAPYKNELMGWTTDGSQELIRFAKTYSSGSASNTGFQARNAICAVSQDRCTAFCSSDMLGNLGVSGSQNRWDIFAYGLCGQ